MENLLAAAASNTPSVRDLTSVAGGSKGRTDEVWRISLETPPENPRRCPTPDTFRILGLSSKYGGPSAGYLYRARVLMLRRQSPPEPAGNAFADDVLGLLEPLYGTALRLTRNRADAEDLVQDTFVKALRASAQFTPGTNLKAWLFTILHNTWRNRVRDAARGAVQV